LAEELAEKKIIDYNDNNFQQPLIAEIDTLVKDLTDRFS